MARNRKRKNVSTDRDNSTKSNTRGKAADTRVNKNSPEQSNSGEPNSTSEVVDKSNSESAPKRPEMGNARGANNDPEWYSKDNQLVIDSGSLPYAEPLGNGIEYADSSTQLASWGSNKHVGSNTGKSEALPGVLTLFTKSSFGTNRSIRDPLNVAANMLYTHVRYMNSGRKNYDPADLMIYVGTFADIYSYLVWMQRIYAKGFIYSQRNKYIGDALLKAENIDAADIKANLANMRYWINTYINKLASYAIPAEIYYFNRRVWMYSGIYLENPDANIKDQLYQFSPDGFYQFGLDSNSAGCLFYKKLSQLQTPSANGYTWTELKAIGEALMVNVVGDEDFGLMSGDIMKAFDGRIISLPPLPEVVDIVPVYSEYVLEQFHNADVYNTDRGNSTGNGLRLGDVWQDPTTGLLKSFEGFATETATYNAVFERMQVLASTRKLLTLNSPVPNAIDNMEISRLSAKKTGIYIEESPGTDKFYALTCGADIAVILQITYVDASGDVQNVTYSTNAFSDQGTPTMDILSRLRIFKYAPNLIYYHVTRSSGADGGNIDSFNIFGNINNYTLIDSNTLDKMHTTAMLSLLSVPGVAKLVNVI